MHFNSNTEHNVLAGVFHGPFTILWHFQILSSSFPFWSSIILPALPLHTNQFSLKQKSLQQRVTTSSLGFFLQRCLVEPLRIKFYFVNIGLWALILRDIAFASYFGKSFFLPPFIFYLNLLIYCIFGCVGSSLLCAGFSLQWLAEHGLQARGLQ